VNIFLVTTLTGTLFQSIGPIIDHPSSVLQLLGDALPQNAGLFINLVILQTCTDHFLELSRLVPLLCVTFRMPLAVSENEKEDILAPGGVDYGWQLPYHLLIFVIVLSYAVVQPVILPFGMAFFAIGYFVWKHQYLYVYIPSVESGGAYWSQVFRYLTASLFIGQLTVIGAISLKQGYEQVPALVPLPFLTAIFFSYYTSRYHGSLRHLAIEVAARVDRQTAFEPGALQRLRLAYIGPSLVRDLEHILDYSSVGYHSHYYDFPHLFDHPSEKAPSRESSNLPPNVRSASFYYGMEYLEREQSDHSSLFEPDSQILPVTMAVAPSEDAGAAAAQPRSVRFQEASSAVSDDSTPPWTAAGRSTPIKLDRAEHKGEDRKRETSLARDDWALSSHEPRQDSEPLLRDHADSTSEG